ncbi:hypothetical protein J6590_036313 [Homalodisca vitripennis]|nr:hypothetical protein J6590_036313 [Homalodisca vitripennis]
MSSTSGFTNTMCGVNEWHNIPVVPRTQNGILITWFPSSPPRDGTHLLILHTVYRLVQHAVTSCTILSCLSVHNVPGHEHYQQMVEVAIEENANSTGGTGKKPTSHNPHHSMMFVQSHYTCVITVVVTDTAYSTAKIETSSMMNCCFFIKRVYYKSGTMKIGSEASHFKTEFLGLLEETSFRGGDVASQAIPSPGIDRSVRAHRAAYCCSPRLQCNITSRPTRRAPHTPPPRLAPPATPRYFAPRRAALLRSPPSASRTF